MPINDFLMQLSWAFSLLLPILISGLFFIACMKRGWLAFLDKPMDFGLALAGKRIFGPNKNWRGALIYVFGGTAITVLFHQLTASQGWLAPIYQLNPYALGLASTMAYVAGELANSFIKRRLKIAAGAKAGTPITRTIQAFFDNADGALAATVVTVFGFGITETYVWLAFALALITHWASDLLMKRLSLKH